jgi:hypothetical protein
MLKNVRKRNPPRNDNDPTDSGADSVGSGYVRLLAPLFLAMLSIEADLDRVLASNCCPAHQEAQAVRDALEQFRQAIGIMNVETGRFLDADAFHDFVVRHPVDWVT